MKLHELSPAPGSRRERKRIGRGYGSGKGKTGGKGMMGQKARSGPNPSRVFEGGQFPLARKLPHLRGFKNRWRIEYQVLNVSQFSEWPTDQDVTLQALIDAGVIEGNRPLKILGDGDLDSALTIEAHKFSNSARQKIEAAGGKIVETEWVTERNSRSRGPNLAMRNRRAENAEA
ncbi:MAG TPA: 50S ribosomal protein L15 [Roseiflexaceae bacterium]|nr:50S ribosomal protein L15 [Roseiflexaceae bacterium]